MYPTQYSKIVIKVKYCACPTSELNRWVKSWIMDFLKIVYVKGGHWVCFSSPPFSCPSPAFSCHSSRFSCSFFCPLFMVSLLSFFSCFTLFYVFFRSVYYLLSLLPVLHPLFLSSTLLPLCPPLICIIFIRSFYLFFCIFWYFLL